MSVEFVMSLTGDYTEADGIFHHSIEIVHFKHNLMIGGHDHDTCPDLYHHRRKNYTSPHDW